MVIGILICRVNLKHINSLEIGTPDYHSYWLFAENKFSDFEYVIFTW